jgi:ubiquinone/menaquinone biosynthesis C-methylase UbiE
LFPHLENKDEALSQFNRVLKPGGKLVIAHALSSQQIKSHHHNAALVVAHDELPSEAEMRRMLKTAGFENVQITDVPGCYLCISNKL